jgi:hypothetical protein
MARNHKRSPCRVRTSSESNLIARDKRRNP